MYEIAIGGRRVAIYESDGLFSPSHADKGTLAMLSTIFPTHPNITSIALTFSDPEAFVAALFE